MPIGSVWAVAPEESSEEFRKGLAKNVCIQRLQQSPGKSRKGLDFAGRVSNRNKP